MENITFLHNTDLLKNFSKNGLSKNIARMHDTIALHEIDILNLIQLTFDWTRRCNLKKRYAISKEYKENTLYPNTWSLYNVDSNWNRESIQKGVEFLSNHLDYLPEFIIDSAYTIMGECIGYKVEDWNFIMPKNDVEYKEFIELGKCHLSVFMMIIEELGKLGIDCRAININTAPYFAGGKVSDCFDGKSYIGEIKKIFKIEGFYYSEAFRNFNYQDSLNPSNPKLKNKVLISQDFYYETDKVYRLLTFNNLIEFLEILLKNIERICTFNSDMIDPKYLDFTKNYYPNEALPNSFDLPVGQLIDAKECISGFLEKLKNGIFIQAYYEKESNLSQENTSKAKSQELSQNPNLVVNSTILKAFINYLLSKNYVQLTQEQGLIVLADLSEISPAIIKELTQEDYNQDKQSGSKLTPYQITIMINAIISIQNINVTNNIFVDQPLVNDKNNSLIAPTPSLLEGSPTTPVKDLPSTQTFENSDLINELLRRIQNVEENQAKLTKDVDKISSTVDKLSKDLETIKEQLIAFLETGNNKPNLNGLDKKQVRKIIENYKPQTFASKVRKSLLMGSLLLGMLSILNSSASKTQEIATPDLTPATPPIVAEQHIDTKPTTPNIEETISMQMFEENNGMRKYYESIYDSEEKGMTDQEGIVIRYYAFKNNQLEQTIKTESELKEFLQNNNPEDYTWKLSITCLDYSILAPYIEQGLEIPIEYTTFFTDYVPTRKVVR